jgi:heavy metal sensor kinase
VLLLGLTFALLGSYLYLRLQRNLIAQVDTALRATASQALINVGNEDGHPVFQDVGDMPATIRRLRRPSFAVRILGLDGVVWDGLGDYRSLPAGLPTHAGYVTRQGQETSWRIYTQEIRTQGGQIVGWLQAAQSLVTIQEALENLRIQLLLGLPLVLLLAGAGGFFLANRALRPIDDITCTARAIGVSDLSRRLDYQGPLDEVGRLAHTFNRMLDRLQDAFARERRFTADAAHELRTPLAVLKGHIGVILGRPRSPATYEHALRDLEREVDRLIRLTTDLLFLSRLDQGRLSWQPEVIGLGELLTAVVEQVQPLADEKSLALTTTIAPNLDVEGNADHLIRLFLNLLDNAIKYTPAGGKIHVAAERDGTGIEIVVQDTGPGIPADELPHLFERFYRVDADRSRKTGGAGLGLAIAHEIARSHNGDLSVQSGQNRGTTFTVHLPARVPPTHNS